MKARMSGKAMLTAKQKQLGIKHYQDKIVKSKMKKKKKK